MWEVLCCASQAHHTNVVTIEELRATNAQLSARIEEVEGKVRVNAGFSDPEARSAKRHREEAEPTHVPKQDFDRSDVWGQFEQAMSKNQSSFI